MQENNDKKVPKLRFLGFDGDWEVKRLESLVSTFKSGKNITSTNIFEEGDYPVYGGNGIRGYTTTYNHEGFYFLIGRQGALCGNINRTYDKAYISEHAIACQGNNNSSTEWLAQKLEYENLNRLSESTAQPGLSAKKLLRLKIAVPQVAEQQKIGNFLSSIDKKISLLAQKTEQLEAFKKGMMQQLLTGKKRFQEFVQKEGFKETKLGMIPKDWEVRNSGQVVKYEGGAAFKSKDSAVNGVKWLKIANVGLTKIKWETKSFLPNHFAEKHEKHLLKDGDIVLALTRPILDNKLKIAKLTKLDVPSLLNQRVARIKPNKELCLYFFYYVTQVQYFINRMNIMMSGSDPPNIGNKDLYSILIPLPSLPEQKKIADCLNSIDQQIEDSRAQLEATKTYKKGLLQQLLV